MYKPMRLPKHNLSYSLRSLLLLVLCCLPLTDSRAEKNEINIPSTFNEVELSKKTVVSEIIKCLPSAPQDFLSRTTADFPEGDGVISTVSGPTGWFVIRGTRGYCVPKSTNGYPILATEAFQDTVNPSPVPTRVAEQWYKQIATLIAQKGSAKVAYVFDNGNAALADYSSTKGSELHYSLSFKKAGGWETEKLDAKFSDKAMQSCSIRQYGGKFEKSYFLLHRYHKE